MTIVETRVVTGGVDTHLDTHVSAALDNIGGLLGVESFRTTPAGYEQLSHWLSSIAGRTKLDRTALSNGPAPPAPTR